MGDIFCFTNFKLSMNDERVMTFRYSNLFKVTLFESFYTAIRVLLCVLTIKK